MKRNRDQFRRGTMFHFGLVFLTIFVLSGCSVFQSQWVDPAKAPPQKNKRQGLAYFLPLGKIHITAVRVDTLITNLVSLKTNTQTTFITNFTVTVSSTNFSTNTVTTNIVTVSQPKDEVSTTSSYQVTISEEYERDPQRIYLLNLSAPWTSEDQVGVVVGTNGFLNTINSTNADKSGDIVVELAKAAIESFKIAAGGFPTGAGFIQSNKPKYPQRIDLVFNPFEDTALQAAVTTLSDAGLDLDFQKSTSPSFTNAWQNPSEEVDGFYYRPLLPYVLEIHGGNQQTISKTVLLPNEAPIFSYGVRRSAFVQRITQVKFVNGCLSEVYVSKPSEALELARTPIKIVQAVASIPTNLIQLKFDVSSARTKLLTQQSNEIAATMALIEAQRKLLELQQKNATNTVSQRQ
jgi:hypothetical protein